MSNAAAGYSEVERAMSGPRRRDVVFSGLALGAASVAGRARAGAAQGEPAEFVGVNTHIHYTDGRYADIDATVEKLRWLGIRHVRNDAPNPSWEGQHHFEPMIAAGIRFSLVCSLPPAEQLAAIKARFRDPSAIAQIEGPNELNNAPNFRYAGRSGPAAGAPYMTDLRAALDADPFFRGIPTASVVSYPNIATLADRANVHSYPKHGARPRGQLRADIREQLRVERGRPVVVTEAGYNTQEVSESAQARLTLELIDVARELGVVRLYLYELLDDRPENHWGLFRHDGSPKPAAEAVRNLLIG